MTGAARSASRRSLDPRTPILVGIGTASADAEPSELMTRALLAAGADTGRSGLLAGIDRIAVPQGSWSYADPGRLVADGVGASEVRTHLFELGIPQQSLINDALAAIVAGTSVVAVVVGGEARRWARGPGRPAGGPTEDCRFDAQPDVVHRRTGPLLEPVEVTHRLWEPVQQYAMIDNALRAAEGRTLAEHRAEIADLWARCNRVARANPLAAFADPMDAREIDTPSPSNRPLAFPYNKWHSTQWTVDQAAALVFCSAGTARDLGVSTDRWVFPLVGVESGHAASLLRRRRLHAWPAMRVLGEAATARLGRPLTEVETTEVYSCFPAAVRVQQRALALDIGATPTVTGGMAFAGGPFNNFVLQSMAAVIPAVRADPGSLGLVTTVSGLLTKPGIGVWSAVPDGRPLLLADLAHQAASVTEMVDVVEAFDGYDGAATVATYTVTYEGMDPSRTEALCDTPDGRRCVAISEDADLARHAVSHELIGTEAWVGKGSFALV